MVGKRITTFAEEKNWYFQSQQQSLQIKQLKHVYGYYRLVVENATKHTLQLAFIVLRYYFGRDLANK